MMKKMINNSSNEDSERPNLRINTGYNDVEIGLSFFNIF